MTTGYDPVCRRYVTGAGQVGAVCPECDHQDALHPGAPNPGVDGCLACTVLVLIGIVVSPVPPPPALPRSTDEPPHLGADDHRGPP